MFIPFNEMGIVVRFTQEAPSVGWELLSIGAAFPDAVVCIDGEAWNVEFEYAASSFLAHGHDIRQADMIICWKNDLQDFPIPIVALSNDNWASMPLYRATEQSKELEYWKQRALRAERRLGTLSRVSLERREAEESSAFQASIRERQKKVAEYALQGRRQVEIASALGVSIRTVQGDFAELKKLGTTATNGVSH